MTDGHRARSPPLRSDLFTYLFFFTVAAFSYRAAGLSSLQMSSLPPQSHLLPFPRPPPRGRHGRELPLGPVGRGLDSRVGELRGLRTSAPAAPTPRASAMPSVHGGAAAAYQAVPPGAPYKAEPLCNRRNRHTPQHATSFRESRFDDAISPRAKKIQK